MFGSKFARIVGCIIFFSVCAAAMFAIVVGIIMITDGNEFGAICIGIGIAMPVVGVASIYPIFALASIDDKIKKLVEELCDKTEENTCDTSSEFNRGIEDAKTQESFVTESNDEINTDSVNTVTFSVRSEKKLRDVKIRQDVLDYFEARCGLFLDPYDNIEAVKQKIFNMDDTAEILKRKVFEAQSLETIVAALILYKTAHE